MPLNPYLGLSPSPEGIVAFVEQTNNYTTSSTADGLVITTPQWLAVPGRFYLIVTSTLHWQSTVAADTGWWSLRLAQNGAAATATSPRLTAGGGLAGVANSARGKTQMFSHLLVPGSVTGLCQAMLTFGRPFGSGTLSTPTANLRPRQIIVFDKGT